MTCYVRQSISWSAILLLAGAAACAQPAEPDQASAADPILYPYIGHQGRLLLGFKDPDVRQFSFAMGVVAHVDPHGELTINGVGGQSVVGQELTATDGTHTLRMHILDAVAPSGPDLSWAYGLEQFDATTALWSQACDTPIQLVPPSDPPVDPPRAIAMRGSWGADGQFASSPIEVSFACKTGVAAKCDGWGFPDDAVWPSSTLLGTATHATGADLMQACTRMARADYCATGYPNTLDGTPIFIGDVFTPPAAAPAGFFSEAAWPGVATSKGDADPLRQPVVCFSKARWSTLPLGGDCPLLIPDPRLTGKAKFCDDIPQAQLEAKHALLFSWSTFLDAGLYTFSDLDSGLRLTTASLLPQSVSLPPKWTISPPPGVPFPASHESVAFEATIFQPQLPPEISPATLAALRSFNCDAQLNTTTTQLGPPCKELAMEGWVYPPNTPGRAPLRRWHQAGIKTSWTTATSPTQAISDGWVLDEVVGGVLRAAISIHIRWSQLTGYTYALAVQTRAGGWISCIDSTLIGTTPGVTYDGTCPAASTVIHHADIIAFRVTYTLGATSFTTHPQPYDGFASDVYIDQPVPSAATKTALEVTWNDLGNGTVYAVYLEGDDGLIRCADPDAIANDTSYVHLGRCPFKGTDIKVSAVKVIQVCSTDRATGVDQKCVRAKWDHKSWQVNLKL